MYDGALYKKHSSFVSSPGNITMVVNTDGVQIFRSSKFFVWPLWLIVNELPPTERCVTCFVFILC